jgi:hypothetical protein
VLSREVNNSNFVNTARDNAGINDIYICDNTFNDSCLFEKDTNLIFKTSGSNNFIGNESLEIDKIADFDINLDFLNDISSVKMTQIAQS